MNGVGVGTSLPIVKTRHPQAEVVRRLALAARRGRVAGFEQSDPKGAFSAAAFGETFDYRLIASASPDEPGCTLSFTLDMVKKAPWIMGIVVLLTIWPGAWLTESMLSTYSDWYGSLPSWVTYAWYLPITVVPLPWMWKRMHGKSLAAAETHAREQIATIASEVEGVVSESGR